MKRNCSLDEISDGNLYTCEDLVEVSCNGCKGDAMCCHGMGNTIILDPYDIYRLTTNSNMAFEELLKDRIELNLVDGVILPNLKMTGESESCAYLNEKGRCNIHSYRPGICRIFPLGRVYDDHSFQYFLQADECQYNSRTKVRVSKWIDTPELTQYEKFLTDWHYFLNDAEIIIKSAQDEKLIKNLNMYLLNSFFVRTYDRDNNFYPQFERRLEEAAKLLKR
jgi:uncharacterized protein